MLGTRLDQTKQYNSKDLLFENLPLKNSELHLSRQDCDFLNKYLLDVLL